MHLPPERKPENLAGGMFVLAQTAAVPVPARCMPETRAATEKKP